MKRLSFQVKRQMEEARFLRSDENSPAYKQNILYRSARIIIKREHASLALAKRSESGAS